MITTKIGINQLKETLSGPWIHDNATDLDYKISQEGELLAVDFRGTTSLKDAIKDVLFFPKKLMFKDATISAHGGFLDQYLVCRNIILDKIYDESIKKVIVRGHSLGGALSQICTYDIAYHIKRDNLSITVEGFAYESPRPWLMNKEVKEILSPVMNLVLTFPDPIIHLPFWLMMFRSYGKKIWIGKWWKLLPFQHDGDPLKNNLKVFQEVVSSVSRK